MTLHIPTLDAPPVPAGVDDPVAAAAEQRRRYIESLVTVLLTAAAITLISVVGVALELG